MYILSQDRSHFLEFGEISVRKGILSIPINDKYSNNPGTLDQHVFNVICYSKHIIVDRGDISVSRETIIATFNNRAEADTLMQKIIKAYLEKKDIFMVP